MNVRRIAASTLLGGTVLGLGACTAAAAPDTDPVVIDVPAEGGNTDQPVVLDGPAEGAFPGAPDAEVGDTINYDLQAGEEVAVDVPGAEEGATDAIDPAELPDVGIDPGITQELESGDEVPVGEEGTTEELQPGEEVPVDVPGAEEGATDAVDPAVLPDETIQPAIAEPLYAGDEVPVEVDETQATTVPNGPALSTNPNSTAQWR